MPNPPKDTHPRTRALRNSEVFAEDGSTESPVRRVHAACGFKCSALNGSPFFQTHKAIAAILRASVSRAMAGCIPFIRRFS